MEGCIKCSNLGNVYIISDDMNKDDLCADNLSFLKYSIRKLLLLSELISLNDSAILRYGFNLSAITIKH